MKTRFREHFSAHAEAVERSIEKLEGPATSAASVLVQRLSAGGKVLVFGNGGSAAEAGHLAEELVGRFRKNRRPLPAISLSSDTGAVTCIANDFGYETIFERQIEAFAQAGDVAIALTTSGKSENVLRAVRAARSRRAVTIALTGEAGLIGAEADHLLAVPSPEAAIVQEVHLMLIHCFCLAVEEAF